MHDNFSKIICERCHAFLKEEIERKNLANNNQIIIKYLYNSEVSFSLFYVYFQ